MMPKKFVCLLLFSAFVNAINCELTFLSEADKSRLKKVVELKEPLNNNDLSTIYYNVNLNVLLDKAVTNSEKICSYIKSDVSDNLENIYFITSAAKLLPNCQLDANKYLTKIQSYLKKGASVQELHRAGLSLKNLGKPIDSAKLSKLLLESIKQDETLLNTGLAFQLASKFSKPEEMKIFVDKIGDVIVQADEVNEKHLQFEGGLGVSSSIINGIYQLATASNTPIGITNKQALKFVNYFLSRKYVLTSKGASDVIETLSLFTNNKFHIPYIITKYGSSALSAENPILTLKVSNVLGQSVGPVSVTASTITRNDEKNSVMQNVVFQPVTGDSTLFAYDFFKKPLPSGFYSLSINAVPQKSDPRILGNNGVVIGTNILTHVDITNVEFTITDLDVGNKNIKLEHPSSVTELLEADYSQRIQLKFQLKDKMNKNAVEVHQAFLRFYNEKTKQEIIFIAEFDSTGTYKVELNLQTRAKDFNNLSGVYQINLIIGDPLVMNSLNWKIASINIQFSGQAPSPMVASSEYTIKPEIKHIFREQEKRPHPMVSNFFTFLVLVPFLALFIMWYKIGVNLSGFTFSLSAIIFHLSLGLIFLLYVCFFVKLNMFQTVKYLAGFSVLSYLSGHSLLSSLIKKQK